MNILITGNQNKKENSTMQKVVIWESNIPLALFNTQTNCKGNIKRYHFNLFFQLSMRRSRQVRKSFDGPTYQ